jgi:hypothetical protein
LGDVNWWMPAWLGRLLPKGRAQPTEGPVGSLQPALVGSDGDGHGPAVGDGHGQATGEGVGGSERTRHRNP